MRSLNTSKTLVKLIARNEAWRKERPPLEKMQGTQASVREGKCRCLNGVEIVTRVAYMSLLRGYGFRQKDHQ